MALWPNLAFAYVKPRAYDRLRRIAGGVSTLDGLGYITTIATFAVAIALIFGLRTMMKGDNPNLSQKFMRWRVGLQFVAIIILMVTVYLRR